MVVGTAKLLEKWFYSFPLPLAMDVSSIPSPSLLALSTISAFPMPACVSLTMSFIEVTTDMVHVSIMAASSASQMGLFKKENHP